MWISAAGGWGSRGQPGQLLEEVQYHAAREDFSFHAKAWPVKFRLTEAIAILGTQTLGDLLAGLDDVVGSKAVAACGRGGQGRPHSKNRCLSLPQIWGCNLFSGLAVFMYAGQGRSVERKTIRECTR